jgi:hypothetical protein
MGFWKRKKTQKEVAKPVDEATEKGGFVAEAPVRGPD